MRITLGSNTASLGVQRSIADVTNRLNQSYERLSSGLRINRASDDAAGLAISKSLNTDAKVFSQAIRNGSDGISLLAIADAALADLSSIVIRIRELATQAANSSYSDAQRKPLDEEAQALAEEYFRISRAAEFNGIKLFDGSLGQGTTLQLGYGSNGSIMAGIGGNQATGEFVLSESPTAGASANGILSADVNGDGNLDLLSVSSSAASELSVFFGNGDGTFDAAQNYAGVGGMVDFELGDVNNDGVLDVVSGGLNGASVRLGNGDGTFQAATTFGTNVYGLQIADLNGDGYQDIVTSSSSTEGIRAYLGSGDGSFALTHTENSSLNAYYDPRAGDFNGDGIVDILVQTDKGSNGHVQLLVGNGDGTFASPVDVAGMGETINRLEVGDFNSDGFLDFLALDSDNDEIYAYLNDGTGNFAQSYSLSQPSGFNDWLNLADVNGDGVLDFTITAADELRTYLGNEDGTFTQGESYSPLLTARSDIEFADYNGDGVLDLAVNLLSTKIEVALGQSVDGVNPLNPFSLKTAADARQAFGTLDNALDNLSTQRGEIGAFQSRVDHALNNLQIGRENFLTAAGAIENADVADEAANLVKNQILQEAATAILAQANQVPGIALLLLE
ncbi:MAG: VCBS repeat-containing protein [Bdellovibrionales bacterium]|nr:VCBS repeat-containing protein [Bdellovibrionales bacterium]